MIIPCYYENPHTLHVGTMPNRAYYIPASRRSDALVEHRETSDRFQLLNGSWKFRYYASIYDLQDAFYEVGYDASAFDSIPVPSVWQNHGYDHHQYTNIRYPFPADPPYVPKENRFGGPLFLYVIALLLPLGRVGRHQFIELCILGKRICERHNIPRAANQSAACGDVGDVAKLVVGDVQQLRQFRAACGALVQHYQKLRVCQHQAGGVGAQQLIHILRQSGHKTVVLADAFPQLVEKIRAVLIAEQNVKLIAENPRSAAFLPVLDNAVVNRIQRHQHTQRHKLFTQFADVISNNPRLRVYIGMPGKGVQRAGNEQFGRQRQPLRFGFRLHLEQTVKVLQRGRRTLVAVADIRQIHLFCAATEDGLFFRRHHAVTDELLKQRQHKLRLADDGVSLITVGAVHVQRVDVRVGRG